VREKHRIRDPLEQFTDSGRHRVPVRRWAVSPIQLILDKEAQQVIDKAIAQLPDMYRHVYVLADIEELPTDEIARLLGLSVAAVKSRLHRARLWMRNALAPYFEERAA
jgi:RNA polymerase sigma-70 factor (ECF subfamily)